MERGRITAVTYDDGAVFCNVNPIRKSNEYRDVPVMKPTSGHVKVPQINEEAIVDKLEDGTRIVVGVISRRTAPVAPENAENGQYTIKFDEDTEISFEPTGSGYDVSISASGSVTIDSADSVTIGEEAEASSVTPFEHTHDFSTTDSNGDSVSGTTDTPNGEATDTAVE